MNTSTTSGRKAYPSDVSEREWAALEPLIPAPKPGGRPVRYPRREIVNGICYVLRTGGSWRQMPHDLPPWPIVYHYFRLWSDAGTWERINTALRERLRVRLGRQATPSAALLDSQSVKTTEKGGLMATTAASW
jgi:putative transposase